MIDGESCSIKCESSQPRTERHSSAALRLICATEGQWGIPTLGPRGLVLIHRNCSRNVETLKLKWIAMESQNHEHKLQEQRGSAVCS